MTHTKIKVGDRVFWRGFWGTVRNLQEYPPHGTDARVDWDDVPGRPSPWIRTEIIERVVHVAMPDQREE